MIPVSPLPNTQRARFYAYVIIGGKIMDSETRAGRFAGSGSSGSCFSFPFSWQLLLQLLSHIMFRSGIWASLVGFAADGIGSKTKWWFWPNAFMRETVGLLINRWKQEVLFLLALIIFFGLLTMMVG